MKTNLILLGAVALLLISTVPVHAISYYSFQVGAWGDNSSVGNRGVQAQIETVIQPLQSPDLVNAYWVGNNLQGEGFIQFGYEATNGIFCDLGYQPANSNNAPCTGYDQQFVASKPVWFYQYWPNVMVQSFYYGMGQDGSAGVNGTWNTYTIQPALNNSWEFLMNGQTVGAINIPAVPSSSVAYMEAEKVSDSATTGPLGPVEFRDLQYYNGAAWNYVNSLTVLRSCGVAMKCTKFPFGVTALDNNDILAGSNQPLLINNAFLTAGGISPISAQVHNSTIENSVSQSVNETALILQQLNQTPLLQEEIDRAKATQPLNDSYAVTLIVPSMIDVSVDGAEDA